LFDHFGGTSKQRSWRGNEYQQLQVLGSRAAARLRCAKVVLSPVKENLSVGIIPGRFDRPPARRIMIRCPNYSSIFSRTAASRRNRLYRQAGVPPWCRRTSRGTVLPWSGCLLNADNELLLEPYESPMIARTDSDRLTPPEVLQHAHISRWCQLRQLRRQDHHRR
jgi:hypothetical protein